MTFCSARAVTVVIFGHFNRSFYLLTYFVFLSKQLTWRSLIPGRERQNSIIIILEGLNEAVYSEDDERMVSSLHHLTVSPT